jgi:hypothetical protein
MWLPTHQQQQPVAAPAAAPAANSAATPAATATAPAPAATTAATPAAPVPAKPAGKKNKEVELAPEADVQNDVDDIDVQGM